MNAARFEPEQDKPYAVCNVDGVVLETREEANAHMMASLEAATPDKHGNRSGHRISIHNQTRQERINSFIADAEREAVDDAVEAILDAIDDGDITSEEALAAPYCNGLVEDELAEAIKEMAA